MKTELEKHLELRKKSFNYDIVRPIFNDKEIDIIKKYGAWMEGLYLKKINPLTKEQEKFVASINNDTVPDNEIFAVYWKFNRRRELSKKYNLNNNEKKTIKDDREDWKKIRKSRY
tara:strand:+ start:219 stop:563 length:345 start_codon:yes stop_codon:yes gene_type:complete